MTEELAYVAENDVILEAITRRLDAIKDRVDVMYSTKAEEIHIPGTDSGPDSNTFVEIKLNDGTTLKTKLLVGIYKIKTTFYYYYTCMFIYSVTFSLQVTSVT